MDTGERSAWSMHLAYFGLVQTRSTAYGACFVGNRFRFSLTLFALFGLGACVRGKVRLERVLSRAFVSLGQSQSKSQ